MAHSEKMTQTQSLFKGRIIEVKKDKVLLENGKETTREVVVHHGGVCIAAIDEQDNILLVKQFRYPYGQELIELRQARSSWEKTLKPVVSVNWKKNAAVQQITLKS